MSWMRRAFLPIVVLGVVAQAAVAQRPPPEDWLEPQAVELQVTYDASGSGTPANVKIAGTGDLFLAGEPAPSARLTQDAVDHLLRTAVGGCKFLCPTGFASVERRPDGQVRIQIFQDTSRDGLFPSVVIRVGEWAAHVQEETAHQAVVIQVEGIPVVREWLVTRDADS